MCFLVLRFLRFLSLLLGVALLELVAILPDVSLLLSRLMLAAPVAGDVGGGRGGRLLGAIALLAIAFALGLEGGEGSLGGVVVGSHSVQQVALDICVGLVVLGGQVVDDVLMVVDEKPEEEVAFRLVFSKELRKVGKTSTTPEIAFLK